MRRTLTRLTVAGSAAALCAGLAVPAFAGTPSATGSLTGHGSSADALTADQLKAAVDASIARRLADLAEDAAKAAASTKLTDVQKASVAARIQARIDALTALQAQVDAETTVAGIKADLDAFWLARLKAGVDARVAKRVARLTAKLAEVQASTTLTDAEKAAAVTRIQARIDALTALQAKVDAETTLAAARADLRAARGLIGGHDDRFWADGRHEHKGGTDPAKAANAAKDGKGTKHRRGDHGSGGGANEPPATRLAMTHGGYSPTATHPGHGGFNFPMGGGSHHH